jgi:hypothetical protein
MENKLDFKTRVNIIKASKREGQKVMQTGRKQLVCDAFLFSKSLA